MATDCIPQVAFTFEKPVVARFDMPGASADGGAVLLKALDRHLGVTEAVASCLRVRRQPGKVQHAALDLVRQRIFGLAQLRPADGRRGGPGPAPRDRDLFALQRRPLPGRAGRGGDAAAGPEHG